MTIKLDDTILDTGLNKMYYENYINAICIILLGSTNLKQESEYSWEHADFHSPTERKVLPSYYRTWRRSKNKIRLVLTIQNFQVSGSSFWGAGAWKECHVEDLT